MSKEEKAKSKTGKAISFETLQTLYFSGKVKPSLNKILVELERDGSSLELTFLACKCLLRSKGWDQLLVYADAAIGLDDKNADGYYYKGVALHNIKGKEQDAIKNFNEALSLDPENTTYLIGKATTHLLLFTNYDLPIKFAEKQRDKGEDCLSKAMALIEAKSEPTYLDFLAAGDISVTINKNLDGKKYYINAVNAFEKAEAEGEHDRNIYKDIIKAQKACLRLIQRSTIISSN